MKIMPRNNITPLHFFVFILFAFCLSACGGSGGSEGQVSPINPLPAPTPNPGPEANSVVALEALTTGSCADILDGINGVEFVRVIACNQPHQYEKAGTYELSDFTDQYPGRIAIERIVHKGCRALYESHTGQVYSGRDFGIQAIYPSRSTWDEGDRTVECLLMNIDRSMLTGSLVK